MVVQKVLQHGALEVEVGEILVVLPDPCPGARDHPAPQWRQLAGQGMEEGCLPRTVGSEDGDPVPPRHRLVWYRQQLDLVASTGEPLGAEHDVGAGSGVQGEPHALQLGRLGNPLQPVEQSLPAPSLACSLARLVPADVFLLMADVGLLGLPAAAPAKPALLTLAQVAAVPALVDLGPARLELDDPVADPLSKRRSWATRQSVRAL